MRQVFKVMMAAVLVALLSWGSVARVFAQEATGRPFITKWRGKAGETLKIPIVGTGYKIVIKNEKGEVVKTEENVTKREQGYPYHDTFLFTPEADGVYTVEAGPEGVKCMLMGVVRYNGSWLHLTSNYRLLEVVQFGTVAWESMRRMFMECDEMTFAANIDTPDLTKVTNMEEMFQGCSAFNQPLEKWDVSKVTSMSWMFHECSAFNQPLEKWDVSKVTNMSEMFKECKSFNQPLGTWKLWTAIGSLSTTAMSAINYSLSLIGWAKQTDGASNIPFGENVKGLVYNDAGREARAKLIARGWTFEGDVYKPSEKVAISLAKEGEGTLEIEGYNDETLKAVAEGTELTVTATPKDGYSLTSLTAGTQDILATKKFTVTEAVTVKAVFTKNGGSNPGGGSTTFAVTLAKEGEGTLAIEGYNDETLQAVAEGTELTVIATPKEGYALTSLTVGTQDILATKKFTVTGAVTVKAVFTKNGGSNPGGGSTTFAVTLAKEGEGTLAIEGYNDETLKAVAEGIELTVIATPKDGYSLTSLTVGTQDILATKKFTVTEAVTVKAVFKKKGNNGGGNNGGGNGGGSWQPQTPQAVEDAVLASVVVAPNPFTAQLRIVNPEGIAVRYELVTLTGNVVRAGAVERTETIVDTEALPAGLYFVHFCTSDSLKRSVKVIKY